MGKRGRIISAYSGVGAAVALLLAGLGTRPGFAQANESEPHAFTLSGDYVGTHDPSIIKASDTWYVFATGRAPQGQMAIRCSRDLQEWKLCAHVFDVIPEWIQKESPETKDLWAPDISYFNEKYHLYYAHSIFGKNTSALRFLPTRRWIQAVRTTSGSMRDWCCVRAQGMTSTPSIRI